jgi:hypothetical protein
MNSNFGGPIFVVVVEKKQSWREKCTYNNEKFVNRDFVLCRKVTFTPKEQKVMFI